MSKESISWILQRSRPCRAAEIDATQPGTHVICEDFTPFHANMRFPRQIVYFYNMLCMPRLRIATLASCLVGCLAGAGGKVQQQSSSAQTKYKQSKQKMDFSFIFVFLDCNVVPVHQFV